MRQLAEEQAALRRVATLVAGGVAPEEVFAAVTDEAGQLLAVDYTILGPVRAEDRSHRGTWGPRRRALARRQPVKLGERTCDDGTRSRVGRTQDRPL